MIKNLALLLTVSAALSLSSLLGVTIKNEILQNENEPSQSMMVLQDFCDHDELFLQQEPISLASGNHFKIGNIFAFSVVVRKKKFTIFNISDSDIVTFVEKDGRISYMIS